MPGLSELMNTNSKEIPIKSGDTRNITVIKSEAETNW
jgi:hypothetical protein